jgi:Fe-S-cluster containining protein
MQAPNRPHLPALARKTDHWFERANAALLSQVPCRAGCSHCCIGPFPITQLDVGLLQEGLRSLASDQRKGIERHAAEQVSALEVAYPRLRESRYLDRWPDGEIDRMVSDFHRHPCPALDKDGLCALYEYRPLTCRSMGIPIEDEGMVTGACEVQTFVPIVRLSAALRAEEDVLSQQEAQTLDAYNVIAGTDGEELLLPYGFLHEE